VAAKARAQGVRSARAGNGAPRDPATIRDLVRYAVSRFNRARLHFGHGTDNAFDEAVYLVLSTLALPLDRLEPCLQVRLTASERASVLAVIERRVTDRIPAAYLTREAWIGEHRFYVDERAIVPRSFIGEWLRGDPAPFVDDPARVTRVLDLCTGSGCLAVLLALAFPAAKVDAVDLSADALDVAARNVADYGLAKRVRLIRSDLCAGLPGRRYDLIVSNPPYVRADAMAALPAEYRHEPALALAGGVDGLDLVRRILAGARARLEPGAALVVEVGHAREAVERAWPRTPFTWIEVSAGDDCVFALRREEIP